MIGLDSEGALRELSKLYAVILARAEKLIELEKAKGIFPMTEVREHLALAVSLADKIRVGSGVSYESPEEGIQKSERIKKRIFDEWLAKDAKADREGAEVKEAEVEEIEA